MKKMKTRNKLKKTLTALIAAGMIFIAGKTANAGKSYISQTAMEVYDIPSYEETIEEEKFAEEKTEEEKARKIKKPFDLIKWLPSVEFQLNGKTSHVMQHEKLLVDDAVNWAYETETNREYESVGLNPVVEGSVKQPIPIEKTDLNFKIYYAFDEGNMKKDAVLDEDKTHSYSGSYENELLKIKTFLSKEFEIKNKNKKDKIMLTGKIGFQTSDETLKNYLLYEGDVLFAPLNGEEERSKSFGILVGLDAKTKITKDLEGKIEIEYGNESGDYKFIFKYPESTYNPIGWDKGADADLTKKNLYAAVSLGNSSFLAKLFCNLMERKIANSEWDFLDNPCLNKFKWDPPYRDGYSNGIELGINFEKAINKYISFNIGLDGRLPLAQVSGNNDREYKKQENLSATAGLKAKFAFPDIKKYLKGKKQLTLERRKKYNLSRDIR